MSEKARKLLAEEVKQLAEEGVTGPESPRAIQEAVG